MALKVLKQQAQTPVGGGQRTFPAGVWKFTIMQPTGERTRSTPDFMHDAEACDKYNATNPKKPRTPKVAGDTGEILSLWLGNAVSEAAGQDDPGKQIFFQDFVIRDGDVSIEDLDMDAPNGAGWQIQKDARLLANLAIALGATTEVSEGDQTYVELAGNFVELLQTGEFDGSEVIAEVSQRAWESKAGKKGVEAFITQFVGV